MAKPLLIVPASLLAACQMALDAPQLDGYRTLPGQSRPVAMACSRPRAPLADQPVRLAPGCANDANLLQMVERREDLLRGRKTGPTLAEPVGRAAYDYQRGVRSDDQRERRREQASQVETAGDR